MIKRLCDRCGAEIKTEIKKQDAYYEYTSLQKFVPHGKEKELCGDCLCSFEKWLNNPEFGENPAKEVKVPPLPVKETEGTPHWLIWAAIGLWGLIMFFLVLAAVL